MTRSEFKTLAIQRILRLDGATGTELAKRGMPPGVCPEAWILDNPDAIIDVQRCYAAAGSDIVYAPTFGGNPLKLAEFGLADRTEEINRELARLSRRAVPDKFVFADIAPTGQLIEPYGSWRSTKRWRFTSARSARCSKAAASTGLRSKP